MRERGYYWVKYKNSKQWEVGLYTTSGVWVLPHGATAFRDSELLEINETRIPEPKTE